MKNSHKIRLLAGGLMLLPLFFINSCAEDKFEEEVFVGEQQALKEKNLELWQSLEISDYRFTFNWSCFCFDPVIQRVNITVIGGAITEITATDNGEVLDPDIFFGTEFHYRTVDGLFDWIQDAIDSGSPELVVLYDPDRGFPLEASLNYSSDLSLRRFFVSGLEELVP